MSNSKSQPRRAAASPLPALQAALSDAAANPVRRALWLDALEQQFRPLLPPALASHCRLANVADGRLVFVVDSPVWRAKLRLAAPELVERAQSVGLAITEVTAKVVVQLANPAASDSPRKPLPMSAASREALQAALASLDPPGSAGTPTASGRGSRGRTKP